jgi:rSAM/selenodomain-associated transferase 1
MKEVALAVMAKRPIAGRTKTRLCPPLSAEQAAALFEAMLLDTLQLVLELDGIRLAIGITPPEAAAFFRPISPEGTLFLPVDGADLGECLDRVLSRLLLEGYGKALALNSDGPSLPLGYLRQAIDRLDGAEVVLGPSEDGGYYLIGLKAPQPGLFEGISWSTERVTEQTLAHAKDLGLTVALLPPWCDIDTPVDLERLQDELQTLPPGSLPHTRLCLGQLHRTGMGS